MGSVVTASASSRVIRRGAKAKLKRGGAGGERKMVWAAPSPILAACLLFSAVLAEKDPLCFEPAQQGRLMCRGFFPRFTWNQDRGCHSIVYGGCGGGRNLFVTLEECEAACGDDTASRTTIVDLTLGTPATMTATNITEEVCELPPVW